MINQTTWEIISALARDCPNGTAVIAGNGRKVSYAEMHGMVSKVAHAMLSAGIASGDKVGISGGNSVKWLYTFFAAQKIGAIPVPMNCEFGIMELEKVIEVTEMTFIFTDSTFKRNNLLNNYLSVNRSDKLRIIVFDVACSQKKGYILWREFLDADQPSLIDNVHPQDPDSLYCIQFTSGSTGTPKGVMLTQYAVLNNGLHTGNALHLDAFDSLCLTVPLFHCFGNVLALLACLTHRTPIVLVDYFSPLKVMDVLEKYQCTVFFGVPAMYILMMEHESFKRHKFMSLQKAVVAGAMVSVTLMKRIKEQFSIPYLISGYGLTEASPGCLICDIYCDESLRFSTVGTSFPGVQVKIVDPETGRETGDEIQGEILVKGYNVMRGYYGRECEIIDDEGWLHTGDLAYSKNGYVTMIGRKDDLIIRGGENIAPIDIEEAACSIDGLADAIAFSVPDDTYGEEIALGVISCMPITSAEIISALQNKIANFKLPRYIFFFSAFPKSASGKVLRRKIREIAIADMQKRGGDFYAI